MSFDTDHRAKFDTLKFSLETKNRDQVRHNANGGNTLLFVYPPEEEGSYLSEARTRLDPDLYSFVDLREILVAFIDATGIDALDELLKDYARTPGKIFKAGDEREDYFDRIIHAILKESAAGKIPVVIRTGCLDGTGIDSQQIMENKEVMDLPVPLVIFYPGRHQGEQLFYLNYKAASRYRCDVI